MFSRCYRMGELVGVKGLGRILGDRFNFFGGRCPRSLDTTLQRRQTAAEIFEIFAAHSTKQTVELISLQADEFLNGHSTPIGYVD